MHTRRLVTVNHLASALSPYRCHQWPGAVEVDLGCESGGLHCGAAASCKELER